MNYLISKVLKFSQDEYLGGFIGFFLLLGMHCASCVWQFILSSNLVNFQSSLIQLNIL